MRNPEHCRRIPYPLLHPTILYQTNSHATMSVVNQVISFVKEAKAEWSKVVWPGRQEAIRLTVSVIIISVIVGALVGGLDFVFTNLMNKILIGR